MLENIECLGHSTIKFKKNNKIIYVDPYRIIDNTHDADIIFITHSHYDHFSEDDILKIKNDNTKMVITEDLYSKTLELGFKEEQLVKVLPNNSYICNDIKFETVPSFNTNKSFHPQVNNWVGYIIELNNIKYFITGDTDITEENRKVKCDVLFLPVGGTFTMDYREAAELTNIIKPKIVIPIHYGIIVGTKEDAERFKELVDENITCKIMY